MKSLRLLALALLACACTAAAALACDAHKSATKSASNTAGKVTGATPAQAGQAATTASVATAQKSAKHAAHEGCSAEMAAACQSNAAVASAMGCEAKGTSAAVASNGKAKSAKGGDCCAMKGSSAAVAGNAKGTTSATSATVAAKSAASDCSACHDWTTCESDVRALGARSQVVALKNGAMIVYTTDAPTDVKALQAMVAKRHEKLLTVLAAGGSPKLCSDCRSLRGAIASGKLHREVVNVERGCMTLLTSNDQDIVRRIRNMTGQPVAMR